MTRTDIKYSGDIITWPPILGHSLPQLNVSPPYWPNDKIQYILIVLQVCFTLLGIGVAFDQHSTQPTHQFLSLFPPPSRNYLRIQYLTYSWMAAHHPRLPSLCLLCSKSPPPNGYTYSRWWSCVPSHAYPIRRTVSEGGARNDATVMYFGSSVRPAPPLSSTIWDLLTRALSITIHIALHTQDSDGDTPGSYCTLVISMLTHGMGVDDGPWQQTVSDA